VNDFEISGAQQFKALSKACKVVDKDLRKELNKGIRTAAKPLIKDARASARSGRLPDAGGLASRIAKTSMRVQTRTGDDAGVSIIAGKRRGAARDLNDNGRFRHPVFGRESFVDQSVPGARGWFHDPMRAGAPAVRKDIEAAMDSVARQLAERVR
jgi:hypothetical protein